MSTQAVHACFVRQAGACGGLIESRYQCLLGTEIGVTPAASNRLQFIGYFEYMKELVTFEFLE
jgi:hypothetical protein